MEKKIYNITESSDLSDLYDAAQNIYGRNLPVNIDVLENGDTVYSTEYAEVTVSSGMVNAFSNAFLQKRNMDIQFTSAEYSSADLMPE